MDSKKKIMKKDNTEKVNRLIEMTEVNYPKSKEEIWDTLECKLADRVSKDTKVIGLGSYTWMAVAASIVVLLGLGSFFRFYQVEYATPGGEQLTVQLPDGSMVDMNGASSVKYHPYWWKVNRLVKFEGEAYFEVEKGKRFSVESNNGTTSVLGTSFNIYARDYEYEVNCLTGKVQVEVLVGVQKIIYPNQQAKLSNEQLLVSEAEAAHSIEWLNNTFYFTSASVKRVFREIEIAYDLNIIVKTNDSVEYSGNFKKLENIEDVLAVVCDPLNLKFAKQPTGDYIIKSN